MKLAPIQSIFFPRLSLWISTYSYQLVFFIAGLLGPLGFAPFNIPGMTLLSLALFYAGLAHNKARFNLNLGFFYGLGYFGFGVSWVIVSIHDYGNLNYLVSGLSTLLFIVYLSLYPTLVAYLFNALKTNHSAWVQVFLFSTLWCLSELLRSSVLSGFPWLLVGTSQINTPLKFLFPIIGIYGVSFYAVSASSLLAHAGREQSIKRYYFLGMFVLSLLIPSALTTVKWTEIQKKPISIGLVQANLAMRDKWDESLFWNLLDYYAKKIDTLLGNDLIILPESAIPLPASYLDDYLQTLHDKTLKAKSSLMLGILQPTNESETHFFNAIISLGQAKGEHLKRHLVPFGEYIPQPFAGLNRWFQLPEPNILPGNNKPLIEINQHPIASLICYEIAYPELLRSQMPLGEWIVSISDNGWFGHSLASYQQLQAAQVLATLTGRFHIVVNNDGLSSIISPQGDVIDGLPPFSSGILQSEAFPASGSTPWIFWGDYPMIILCAFFLFLILFLRLRQYHKQ